MSDPSHIPDRAHVRTEQRNPRTTTLHQASVAEIIAMIQAEDETIPDAMARARPSLEAFIAAAEPGFVAGGRLIYIGAGTSGRLGVLDASEAPPTFQVDRGRVVGIIAGGDAALRTSSESREDDPEGARPDLTGLALTPRDTVLAIAAGGTTPYVRGSLAITKELCPEAVTGFLTCSPVETPAACDHMIVIETGPEVITGSTRMKAGTATKLALNTISTAIMIREGRVYENLMVDLRATNAKLRDRAARIVSTLTGLERTSAFAVLDQAGGSVKTAVVMHRRDLDRAGAEACLAEAGGRLDRAITTP